LVILLVLLLFGFTLLTLAAQQELPQLKLPLVVTTAGQSPGALMVYVLANKAEIPCDRQDLLTPQMLQNKAEAGEPFKTLLITTGPSLTGLGPAGVDIDSELRRIEEIIAEAKNQGITLIGAHIEGPARRVDETDAASIRTVIPQSDLILVRNDSNEDGYFTRAAEELGVPLITFEKMPELMDILKALFSTSLASEEPCE
jgi:hypothetical protein